MSLDPVTVHRPWGHFTQFTKNELSTVKLHFLNPGEAMSLQYHKNRDEFWRIISGEGTMTVGNKEINVKEGDELFAPRNINHRIAAKSRMIALEISIGDFDEEDIIRIEDKYGRNQE